MTFGVSEPEIPASPETFTVYVTRENDCVEYGHVVQFEPMEHYYRFILDSGTRVVIPYASDIYAIEVVPDE